LDLEFNKLKFESCPLNAILLFIEEVELKKDNNELLNDILIKI